jgi:hypothetical protein
MSPKKAASKPKWTQAELVESADQDAWRPSKCIDFYLHGLVKEGLLQSREKMQWHRAIGDVPPREESQEIITFVSFVLRGFAIPASDFFRDLLHYWGVQVHHLTPNSNLHFSIFVKRI